MNVRMVDRATLLENLRLSKLLTSQQYQMVIDKLGNVESPREIARTLASWKLITKFQAKMLLAGRNSGFFLGPYMILDLLGQGGMGRVYKAIHKPMNRLVALKILAASMVKTERAQQLFQSEVQAAAQLQHPNIVMAYDANELEGRHYLAMEYIEGPNLEEYVRDRGSLPVGMACEIIFQAASGLQHAFERGMVHRDIKPANLLLQMQPHARTLQVKILDFGLARLVQPEPAASASGKKSAGKENIVMGTPDYISPEQAMSLQGADIRSDLYSLGCTFYYLLAGQVTFPGGTTMDKLVRHRGELPRRIEDLRPDVPKAVADILHKLLAKNPEDRYQTPDELIDAIAPHAAPCMLDWPKESATDTISNKGTADSGGVKRGRSDTEPRVQSSTQIGDEESLQEWVDVHRKEKQRTRRLLLRAAIASAAVMGLALAGGLVWWMLQ